MTDEIRGKKVAMRNTIGCLVIGLILLGLGCGDAANGAGSGPTLEEVNAEFPFTPNQPMNVYFGCALAGSSLFYQVQLRNDSTFTIAAELDTGDIAFATGVYAYENDVIRMQTNPNNFVFLDEQSTSITPALGIVYRFETQVMRCIAIGHEEDDAASRVGASYLCPEFSEGPASSQINAFEFDVALPGAIFRDRNRWVTTNDQPIILRGTGIYRRMGDEYYGYFGDQFDDYNVVSGTFVDGRAAVQVDQLPNGASQCAVR